MLTMPLGCRRCTSSSNLKNPVAVVLSQWSSNPDNVLALCLSSFNEISIIQHQMAKGGEKLFRVYGPRIWCTIVSCISITSAGVQEVQGATLIFHIPVYMRDADPLQFNDTVIACIMLQDSSIKHEITSLFINLIWMLFLSIFWKYSSEQSIFNLALRIRFHMMTSWYLIPVWRKLVIWQHM